MNYLQLKILITALNGRWGLLARNPETFTRREFSALINQQRKAEELYRALLLELARGTEPEARAWWADHVGPNRRFPTTRYRTTKIKWSTP